MSVAVKRIGCSNLKTLIEGNKLIVNDFDTISELTTFVADKTSFKADDGHNDDLVIGELTESDNHKVEFDLTDLDVQFIFHAGINYGIDRMLGKEKTDPVV